MEGETSTTEKVLEGALVSNPGEPKRDGYIFLGWYSDEEGNSEYSFDSPVTSSFTLYALWVKTDQRYTVRFNANVPQGISATVENMPQDIQVVHGSTISSDILSKAPALNGYFFAGWYKEDNTAFAPSTAITGDITLYAHWTIDYHSVTFDANNTGTVNNMPSDLNVGDGYVIYENDLEVPTLDGYVFSEWTDENGNPVSFPLTVASDITLKATWAEAVTVSFNPNIPKEATGTVSNMPQDIQIARGGTISSDVLSVAPSLNGYSFEGWYIDAEGNTEVTSSTAITTSTTLYAKWEKSTFIITYSYYDLTVAETKSFARGEAVSSDSLNAPSSFTGEAFLGWYYEDGTAFSAGTQLINNITLYPRWENYALYDNTYLVFSESGLRTWSEAANSDPSLNCILLSDITLSNPSKDVSNWNPVAKYTGTFDGKGHTITDLSVVMPTNEYGTQNQGFFRSINSGGVVSNLILENVYIENVLGYIGAIAGYSSNGTIENCTASGTIIAGNLYAGGIVGYTTETTISNCINHCEVSLVMSDNPSVGGIVGNARYSTISNCKNFGDLSLNGSQGVYGGGIAGEIRDTEVTSCYNSGSIAGTDAKNSSGGNTERFYLGGIVGTASGSSITDCKIEGCTIEATYNSDYVDSYSFGSIVGNGGGDDSTNSGTATIKETNLSTSSST